MSESRYDILFEPVQIGPVTAPNRFYQVPHCNGMGHALPQSLAAMRGVKAEGGWGVVCTEMVEIHPSTDVSPYVEGRLWDDSDIPPLQLMTEAVHKHGALAGIELAYAGLGGSNLFSREVAMAPSHIASEGNLTVQSRAMSKKDIAEFRRWHREAAVRGMQAGFDLIYVYMGHSLSMFQHFLSPRYNRRNDEYGGSLENRVRLLREVLEETKEAVGHRCGVVCRFAVDELLGNSGLRCEEEGREVVSLLAELPDLWDVNISDWSNDSQTARFAEEGYQEPFTKFVKQVTSKPVVGVGRYTSADRMVSLVKNGVLDMIGAARPSIADPFLPDKIREGRFEDIRECIGCNICVASDMTKAPIRCTQNPTMGEEWRKGWHPEKIPAKQTDDAVLIVGAGPSGLELAMSLGKRGYPVTLAEASTELGGRVRKESTLPGLSSYQRVIDYREGWLRTAPNVDIYLDSPLTAEQIVEFEIPHVYLATGATWRRDGRCRSNPMGIPGVDSVNLFTPDDILVGNLPQGRVVLFDDDHYYMGGVLAEQLAVAGCEVTLVTPAALVSAWTQNTLEQGRIQSRLMSLGVKLVTQHSLQSVTANQATIACAYTERETAYPCEALVLVSERLPNEQLYLDLLELQASGKAPGLKTVAAVGDCLAPGTVAHAVYSGHRHAREHDREADSPAPFRRERLAI